MPTARLIAAAMLLTIQPALWTGIANAETFSNPGYYTVKVNGWMRNASPEGFAYRCTSCKEQVDIEIDYGPPVRS